MSLFNVTDQGVITVDTADIRAEFEQAYKEALGADLNLDVSTPVGQLVVNDTTALTTAMAECVAIANETSVYSATGQALDVAAARSGYYRKTATPTTVVATLTGNNGTTIPAGAKASDGEHEYVLLDTVTIPVSGSVMAQVQCTELGPIACPAGTLTSIVTTISGWDTVTNANDGVPGVEGETDNAFRDRITANYLNKRARSILGAIVDNIAALPDVISVVGYENPTANTEVHDGITMTPHSICVSVFGGSGPEIARVLGEQKTLGATTIGNTTVSYMDGLVNYQYDYKIYRPTELPIYVDIEYAPNSYTGASTVSDITGLITEYIANNPLKIGQTITGNYISMALNGYNKVDVLAVKVSTDGETWDDYVVANMTQIPTISSANITVTENS
jgi:uncharacterized phage protein gp47/JayE